MSSKVTCVIYWASRRAQITSSCLGSDLSRWNMHEAMLEAILGIHPGHSHRQ